MGAGGEGTDLQFTPTWVVASVCTILVAVSFALVRGLHHLGKFLKRKNQESLFQALQKIKEELMLLGFISIFLAQAQNVIVEICVPEKMMHHMLPCKLDEREYEQSVVKSKPKPVAHFQTFFSSNDVFGNARRLLGGNDDHKLEQHGYCASKGKVPLLSLEGLHRLHIFIFVLAICHVAISVLTIVFGGLIIRKWKHWEHSIVVDEEENESQHDPERAEEVTHVHEHEFIQYHFFGFGKNSAVIGWVRSFFKQFYGSVTKLDYVTLRRGFIMTHCRGNRTFNFHKYMNRALEEDFKKVVGISWYLWIFVVIFLLLNIHGWHAYFWIAFIPIIFLLAVGTKLQHVIIQLAHEVAENNSSIEGELVVQPSNDHFWFNRPRIVLYLIHLTLFEISFEIAFLFWILVTYGFDSCIMEQIQYSIPRLTVGVVIQMLCSCSTLPLYALVTQMGSDFNKAIFVEEIQTRLVGWAQKAKQGVQQNQSSQGSVHNSSDATIEMGSAERRGSVDRMSTATPMTTTPEERRGSVDRMTATPEEDNDGIVAIDEEANVR
ncbi:MLO-like protein 1 [Vicia villosa]|uniref:MLO-like protein 1 n=1 Tax=Vicia villosa TaxID=3911 RepID=UPI00273CEA61|nr:MLO-like protein 1 [Vicia villosa]